MSLIAYFIKNTNKVDNKTIFTKFLLPIIWSYIRWDTNIKGAIEINTQHNIMLFLIVKWIDAKIDKENTIHIKYTKSEELL